MKYLSLVDSVLTTIVTFNWTLCARVSSIFCRILSFLYSSKANGFTINFTFSKWKKVKNKRIVFSSMSHRQHDYQAKEQTDRLQILSMFYKNESK